MDTQETKRKQAQEAMERCFAEFDQLAATQATGLLDLLKVYGGYEAALNQANAYLAPVNRRAPIFSSAGTAVDSQE
jgi:hypothetical protein